MTPRELESDYEVMCIAVDRAYEATKSGKLDLIAYEAMCQAIAKVFDSDAIEKCEDVELLKRIATTCGPETKVCRIRLLSDRKLGRLLAKQGVTP